MINKPIQQEITEHFRANQLCSLTKVSHLGADTAGAGTEAGHPGAAGEAAAGDGGGLGPRRGLLRDVVQREHLRRAVLGPRMRSPGLLLAGGGGVATEAQLPPRVRARAATSRALPCTTGGR